MDNYKELIDILKIKKDYLYQIENITEMQTSTINDKDDEQLGKLIDQKQIVIDAIDKLDAAFLEKFNALKSKMGINSLDQIDYKIPEFQDVKNQILEIQTIVKKISIREKENSVKISKEFADIKDKLKELNGGKKAMNAYSGNNISVTGGSFIDNKK